MRITTFLLMFVLFPFAAVAEQEQTIVKPRDNGAALVNPGMGWVLYYYSNVPTNYGSQLAPSDTVDEFPGLSAVYLRIPWSYVEPDEGKYCWSVLDTPAQRWIDKGKKIILCITCSESWLRWATPEWVQKAGAKGHDFESGKGAVDSGPMWEPDYNDPIFLAKLDVFLAALARRYDGNAEVACIDVGSYGVWGEGHTFASSRLEYPPATIKRHIDLYCKHFKKTLLAANDDYTLQGGDQTVIDHAEQLGLTLRDNSILVQGGKDAYYNAEMAQKFWPRLPVILEHEHFGGSRDRGNWQDGSLLVQAVEEYHASYLSIHWWPREFLQENRELIDRINLRMGYRMQLLEAAWPQVIRAGEAFKFSAVWRNAGVAPCLPGGHPSVTLKDSRGGIAAVMADDGFQARDLPVGPAGKAESRGNTAELRLPLQIESGTYDVFVSLGTATGTPQIALPLDGDDGQRRYCLGTIEVVK